MIDYIYKLSNGDQISTYKQILSKVASGKLNALTRFKEYDIDFGVLWTLIRIAVPQELNMSGDSQLVRIMVTGSSKKNIQKSIDGGWVCIKNNRLKVTPKGLLLVTALYEYGKGYKYDASEITILSSVYNMLVDAYNGLARQDLVQEWEPYIGRMDDFTLCSIPDRKTNISQYFYISTKHDGFDVFPHSVYIPSDYRDADYKFMSSGRMMIGPSMHQFMISNHNVPVRSASPTDDQWSQDLQNILEKYLNSSILGENYSYLLGYTKCTITRGQEIPTPVFYGESNYFTIESIYYYDWKADVDTTPLLRDESTLSSDKVKTRNAKSFWSRIRSWNSDGNDETHQDIIDGMITGQKILDETVDRMAGSEAKVMLEFKPETDTYSAWTENMQRYQNDLYWINPTAFWLNPKGPLADHIEPPEWWEHPDYLGDGALSSRQKKDDTLIAESMKKKK